MVAPRVLASRTLVLTLLAGLIVLTPAARGDHDTLEWQHYGTASYALGFDRAEATVFADRRGSVYVFYTTTSTSSGLTNLNVTKFATRGFANLPLRLFDTQVNAAQNSVFGGIAPAVAMDASGALYVAYSEFKSGLSAEVYVSKSVDGGATWIPEVRANAVNAAGKDDHASIAVAPNGSIYVAWIQSWGPARDVTAAVSTNGGASFGSVQNISGPAPSSVTGAVSVTTDSQSRAYVAYDDVNFARAHLAVNFTWSDDGVTWSPPETLSGPNANLFLPAIKADDEDRLHAVWIDSLGSSILVWYTRSEDRGATWTAPITISQNTVRPEVGGVRTSIGISGGTLMVAWTGTQGGTSGLAYTVSADRGDEWSDEKFFTVPAYSTNNAVIDADENGTFYAAPTQAAGSSTAVFLEYWFGPPTVPTVTLFPSGLGQMDVLWTGATERNIVGYRVWRSADGVNYQLIASVGPAVRNLTDRGLANGTYWYSVESVNDQGIRSHPSVPVRGAVAVTEEGEIAILLAEIAFLRAQLAALNNTSSAEAAALQARINELQSRLNALQTDRATQSTLNMNTILSVAIIVLLAVVLVKQFRRPKPQPPAPMERGPPQPEPAAEPDVEPEFEEFLSEFEDEAAVEPSVPEFEEEL